MDCCKVYIIMLFVLLFQEVSSHSAGDFPSEDCNTSKFDVLLLENAYFECHGYRRTYYPDFLGIWTSANVTSVIVPRYSTEEISIGNGNEYFRNCLSSANLSALYSEIDTIVGDIKLKLIIAGLLFDCGIAEENSTHLAIIVVKSGTYLSLTIDEMWELPDILQNEMLNFKVFVLLLGNYGLKDPIFINNFLYSKDFSITPIVQLALCKTCPTPWVSFENEAEDYFPSCYALSEAIAGYPSYLFSASETCNRFSGNLVTIESQKELDFLQEFLTLFVKKKNLKPQFESVFSEEVLIGLQRGTENYLKLFHWARPAGPRPLVLNHWLPNEPDGGPSQSCGVWILNGNVRNLTNPWQLRTSYEDIYIESEGWSSVECDDSRIGLCESSLSVQVPNKQYVIQPANSYSFTGALSRGEYRILNGQIVSVSAYASNEDFYKLMKERNEEFPLFDCGEDAAYPRYISYRLVCDYIDHCSNRRDESGCVLTRCSECLSGQCVYYNRASDLTRCDTIKDCLDGSDEEFCTSCSTKRCCDGTCLPGNVLDDFETYCSECNTGYDIDETDALYNERCLFICNVNECIYSSQLNDGKTDCDGPEGHLDDILEKLETANTCFDKQNQTLWAPKCVYVRDKFGSILGCRDLSHLQNCGDFQCQEGYYKCPGRYCIPIHYVLDEKNDCPSGEDERRALNQSCVGNFACWASQVCLHPDFVCDGHSDCPHKDDELICETLCSPGVRCIASTLTVGNISLIEDSTYKYVNSPMRFIDLSGYTNTNIFLNDILSTFLLNLRLSNCNISELYQTKCEWSFFVNVNILDLSFNQLSGIPSKSFPNLVFLNMSFNQNLQTCKNIRLKRLEILDLSNTGLLFLEKTCLESLKNLKHLNLSHTQISTWNKDYFPSGFTLQTLDLRGAPLTTFFENTFNGLIIKSFLYADNFGLCCPQIRGNGIPSYMCHVTEDAISSCYDLIGVEIQQILLWVMVGIAVLGNLVVILFRLIWDKSVLQKAYGLFVLNLAISDLIMGLYLFVIAGANVYYRGVYVLYDKDWKESAICKTASFLATLSNETSTFFIFLITIDRFLVLKFPFGERKFSEISKITAVALTWAISFTFALIPVLPTFEMDSIFASNAMCVNLLLTNQRVNGWGYSLGVFIVLNFVMFSLIALGQVAIFRSMSGNRMLKGASNQNSLRRAQDITVAKQLSLVVFSNFLCWFPVGFMGFLSLSGHEISNDIYAWTVVLVMPVNSAFNPLLYTIPVLLAKGERFKYGESSHISSN